ncbi:hypothetical protein FA10DRAFT_57726 [Acaromyces ingoldii]|uniref:Uncharacterized protein n=1 Tax=Acaromyces ingoldii TaxID=215250 RepID=A0A316YCS7_9BASI|nr:hypothetical protein FA10DRAFT_57726 [Acaromyces ingoldii]PWN86458.1 hypothetical protein FA10DRAFT_57726 [Acaromyces ingoldii]
MGWDEICVTLILDYAERTQVYDNDLRFFRPNDNDEKASWSFVDSGACQEFHMDLAAIGRYPGIEENGAEIFEEIDLDTSLSSDNSSAENVCLIGGLAYHQAFDDRYVIRKPGKSVYRVPGGAKRTVDLDEVQTDWARLGSHSFEVSACVGGFLVHSRCWELLQGVEIAYSQKTGHVGCMTPRAFWLVGTKAIACQAQLRGKQAACRSFKWLDHVEVEHLHEQWARPLGALHERRDKFKERLSAAVKRSIAGQGVDLVIRDEIRDISEAWAWQPPDR